MCVCIGNHGRDISLGNGASLGVRNGYMASLDAPSLADLLRFELRYIGPDDQSSQVHIVSLNKERLQGRPAYHFIATYVVGEVAWTKEVVLAVSAKQQETMIDYVAYLNTPSERFKALRPVFQNVLRSWRWHAIH